MNAREAMREDFETLKSTHARLLAVCARWERLDAEKDAEIARLRDALQYLYDASRIAVVSAGTSKFTMGEPKKQLALGFDELEAARGVAGRLLGRET